MVAHMNTTTVAGTPVPERHLATSIPGPSGTYWLYGFRAHNGTALFTLCFDQGEDGTPDVLLDAVGWFAAHRALTSRIKPAYVEATLRSVLPAVA